MVKNLNACVTGRHSDKPNSYSLSSTINRSSVEWIHNIGSEDGKYLESICKLLVKIRDLDLN